MLKTCYEHTAMPALAGFWTGHSGQALPTLAGAHLGGQCQVYWNLERGIQHQVQALHNDSIGQRQSNSRHWMLSNCRQTSQMQSEWRRPG